MDGIEKDLEDTARIVRLDISSELGRSVAASYGVSAVPTTLVLDGTGTEVYRDTGLPSRKKIVARVEAA